MDTRALRNTLGQFATGVCILTTDDDEHGAIGMTVNSFSAVSLDPALVLWSIQNTSDCFSAFTTCDRYGISVLAQSQDITYVSIFLCGVLHILVVFVGSLALSLLALLNESLCLGHLTVNRMVFLSPNYVLGHLTVNALDFTS